MILVPSFDPSNIKIEEKIQFALNNLEQYNSLTGSNIPIGHINFILPGYTEGKEALNINLISPNLIEESMVRAFYNGDLKLYITYFGNEEDLRERLLMYEHDLIIKERLISPSWDIAIFVPIHSIESTLGKSKFNLKYGLSLVGPEVNLMNIQKYIGMGITHFNLNFMDLPNSFSYIEAKEPLIKELGSKYPDTHFLLCGRDIKKIQVPENCKVVVGGTFWTDLIH
jgi:hypothetical protein